MAFLTDRTLATGVTLQDLIHIVIPTDVSQNPAGSSYKATIQQVSDAILSGFTGNTQLYEVGSGTDSTQRIGVSAEASGDYSLVGGGSGNTASGDYSTIGGGYYNTSSGNCSTVSGGRQNISSCNNSTISGGYKNTSNSCCGSVGGGSWNTISGARSVIAGGGGSCSVLGNRAICDFTAILGGSANLACCSYATVGGGFCNTAANLCSTVSGGSQNKSTGCSSTVSGGIQNTASCTYSFIGGGQLNKNFGVLASILGGVNNTTSSYGSTVAGGRFNTSAGLGSNFIGSGEGNKNNGTSASIVGGNGNFTNGYASVIGGGASNSLTSNYSVIVGGSGNTTSGVYSIVGGGILNTSISNYGTILGGSGNTVNHIMSAAFGKDVKSVSACTFHANYLALQNVPETDSTNDNMLVRDISTGVIKQRDITSTLNKNYASFYDTGDQTGLANTVLTMSANTSDSWNTGIILSANTIFVIQNPGVYNLAFSAQMVKTGGNSSTHAHIWLYQNGLDVLYSASQIGFPSNNIYIVPAWNFFFSTTTPNEYVELKWEINSNVDNQLLLKQQPATGSVPAIPSLIVTINQVN